MAVIKGLDMHEFVAIVGRVSRERYDGNVIVHQDAHPLNMAGNRFRARIAVAESRGAGARRSWSGRRMPAACWHVIRDVYAEVFRKYPQAVISTSLASYQGLQGFMDNYPETAYKNIGSMFQPAYMPDLCDCSDEVREDAPTFEEIPAFIRTRAPRTRRPVVRHAEPVQAPRPYAPIPDDDGDHDTDLARTVGNTIARIDADLAAVAEAGWTNPYTHEDSPAHRLA